MREYILSLLLIVLFISFASAEIIVDQNPDKIYNLKDMVKIPLTIKASKDISDFLDGYLLCNGNEIMFHKSYINLGYGEEERGSLVLGLKKELLGNIKGSCKIKIILADETTITNEFEISDVINIKITDKEIEFKPGQNILIEGEAIKANGNGAVGFVELKVIFEEGANQTVNLSKVGIINNGYFTVNLTLPKNMKAGTHPIKLKAYEVNPLGETTNKGFADYDISIEQIPTNVEIMFEEQEVMPGTYLKVQVILHDQTGEKIDSIAIVTIKNENNKILEQTDLGTGDLLEYPIKYNQPPAKWTVIAVSNKLTGEATFNIKENKDTRIELVNKTVIVTNIGNVPFCNETLLIKIGDDTVNIMPCLDVDDSQKYVLSAPEGVYDVDIIREGESIATGNVALTGKTTEVKKAPKGVVSLMRYPVAWIFVILILAFIAFMIFRKGYKRSFIGRIHFKKKEKKPSRKETQLKEHRAKWGKTKSFSIGKKPLIEPRNKAELSLSIKGDKQSASVICLRLKNIKDLESGGGNVKETLNKITRLAESHKAVVYENNGNIFFILAPVRTKTFKNERPAIMLAQKMEKILYEHNKLFKQKIEFGISLNYGEIVAKSEGTSMKFMAMERLITTGKKVAQLAHNEVLLSKEMNNRFGSDIKTEKQTKEKVTVYKIKEMIDREKHTAFISSFLKKLNDEKSEK